MRISLQDPSLVLLIGVSGSGKSTLASRWFEPTEVVSSDACRALVADDPSDQCATASAFAVLHAIVRERLVHRRLTVVDATNVQARARRALLEIARHHDLPAAAIVLDPPVALCERRAATRAGRPVEAEVVHRHREQLHKSLPALEQEGFARVYLLREPADVDESTVTREPLPVDRRAVAGPFDIVGDVHGCADELEELLALMGYRLEGDVARHGDGRLLVFAGDLVDRGPRVADVLRLVRATIASGAALAVPGNHDDKLARKLRGRNVKIAHGLQQSLDALAPLDERERQAIAAFVEAMPSHLVLDGGALVVAHAGMREELQGRDSRRVRDYAMFGETTGRIDEHGLPIRIDWAARYQGHAIVVYGHTPIHTPTWHNRTIDIDTGCVFGGALTALRYPEMALMNVPARRQYAVPARPFLATHPDARDVAPEAPLRSPA
ncbi:MAG TPA: AAA family ATPase [Gemmatimonadaceae bacterium]|nr:AAA family ATPase [Gemmatimonadaceae bacterium]